MRKAILKTIDIVTLLHTLVLFAIVFHLDASSESAPFIIMGLMIIYTLNVVLFLNDEIKEDLIKLIERLWKK